MIGQTFIEVICYVVAETYLVNEPREPVQKERELESAPIIIKNDGGGGDEREESLDDNHNPNVVPRITESGKNFTGVDANQA